MAYYIAKTVSLSFDDAITRVTEVLRIEGLGVLTSIDVEATMKAFDLDFRPYRILGACNPGLAHRALAAEDKIGTILPCNVIVHECADGGIEVAAIDPVASMAAADNPALTHLAASLRRKLENALDSLHA